MPQALLSVSGSLSALGDLLRRQRRAATSIETTKSLPSRLADVFVRTWDLGFTAFGGPPVHFKIFHQRFVEGSEGKKWIDEQTYQELFAICQALPGPGSTKMLFCMALLHAGFLPALFVFLIWSLPGAIGMYALSLGVQRLGDVLPAPVYALLSGLNASTVGIIALAAVQLAEKAITDQLARILIILAACAGLCYNALWYFPLILVLGGITTVVWDSWLRQKIGKLRAAWNRRRQPSPEQVEASETDIVTLEAQPESQSGVQRRVATKSSSANEPAEPMPRTSHEGSQPSQPSTATHVDHVISVRTGVTITVCFFASFIGILVARGVLESPSRALDLFANMYLAGTIIFGGGPVVIPLLRSYVVGPGWVSSRDFLLGLAIIQAFPGPNFNFAVYLGALAVQHTPYPTVLGALLGFVGIFFPGISLAVAVQSFWRVLRTKKWVIDLLRGINATAVGLVFTAVYRLWQIGYLTPEAASGQSLTMEPWWLVVATLTYAESAWFNVPPVFSILFGAVLGLSWYGAVGRREGLA